MDTPHPDDLDGLLTALHDEHLGRKAQVELAEMFKGKLESFIGEPLTPERAAAVGRVLRQEIDDYMARSGQAIVTDISCDPETNTINVSIAMPLNDLDVHLIV